MKNKNIISIIVMVFMLLFVHTGCEDAFEPAIENHKDHSDLYNMPAWATGLLGHAYISNPLGSWSFNDVATDDAVSNNPNNGYRLMATGSWTANSNPMGEWQYLRASWQYLNQFIEIADEVNWADDQLVADMFKDRMKGDAFGMRALYMYHLLLNHAGWANGQLLGVPIVTEPEDLSSDFNIPRNTFQECIDQLNEDVDAAIRLLPENYGAVGSDNQVPEKYQALGVTSGQYTRVFGDNAKNRMNAQIAKAVRAQAALLAASPAYSEGSNVTWEEAANLMAEVLNGLGGNPIAEIDPDGHRWYASADAIEALEAGENPKEILWRGNKDNENIDLEQAHYPPTLFGNGRLNPTQNLVDAFPMENGLPITDPNSGYDPNDPYANRDPRLAMYIIYNGSTAGPSDTEIITAADGEDNNALNKTETSTRTGYYMKKLLNQAVNADPNSQTPSYHYKPFIRYTEIFLGYAEAANEAWGPTGTGSNSYSAYDVIKAIRQRAGIGVNSTDEYLESASNNKDLMRELIHNERRLELCFEGFRFWDLRRWKKDITEPAKGMQIVGGEYNILPEVEQRAYQDYMYYGPIPNSEVVKFDNLIQNEGW